MVPLSCSYIRKHRRRILLYLLLLSLLLLLSTTYHWNFTSTAAETVYDNSETVLVRGGGRSISSNIALTNVQSSNEAERNHKREVYFSLTNYSDPMISLSQNKNNVLRERFQRKRVHRFCTRHKRQMRYFVFPAKHKERQLLFEHLLFNDKHKSIFCNVEQIHCSSKTAQIFTNNQKIVSQQNKNDIPLFLSSQNAPDGSNMKTPTYNDIVSTRYSFANHTLNSITRRKRMKDYYKVMIVKNPLERLLSSYLDLIQGKSLTSLHDTTFPYSTISWILEKTRSKEYRLWKASGGGYPLQVSFQEFVEYYIETPFHKMSPHFRPMTQLCHPCRIHYDFYGNEKLCSKDYPYILDKSKMVPQQQVNDATSNIDNSFDIEGSLLLRHYRELPQRLTTELVTKLYIDLDFYYHLYPEERYSHTFLLNT